MLLSPDGSPHPFYAEFGWVGAAGGNAKLPGADTVWRQEGQGALAPGQPVTLIYDNGEGLTFRRTIAVDDNYLFTFKDEVTNNGAPRWRSIRVRWCRGRARRRRSASTSCTRA